MLTSDTIDLVEWAEFLLVGLLGFMPLLIIHWADRRPRVRLPRVRTTLRRTLGAVKASLLLVVADWLQRWLV